MSDARRIERRYGLLVGALFAGYMGFAVGLYLWRGIYFTPDRWAIFLLIGALLTGRLLAFARDWIPFVLLIFGYEVLRGIAGTIVTAGDLSMRLRGDYPNVQLEGLISADRAMFGGRVPTLWLQEKLYDPGIVHWYDIAALLFYALHFVFPLMFAFMLWLRVRERFWQFSLTFLFMTYSAFIFFVLYPAAPPWLAHRWGLLPGLAYPADQAIRVIAPDRFGALDTVAIWGNASPNPVAAMPSLHAAFPWLVMLFAVRYFGKRGLLFLPYNLMLWFSVVYLSQHWVIDILAGMVWATISFGLILLLWPITGRGAAIPFLAPLRARINRARPTSPRWSLRSRVLPRRS
ncbi:MAG: phosphatase PAP2 family protein [Chloroflexota bacterium]|nr:phosphatase PAP2 family protein [Chloroflexota bacterium]